MNLTETELTINKGDMVSFRAATNEGDDVYLTGEVKGLVKGDELTVLVFVNEFLACTIAVRAISKVNNLFVGMNNFIDHINVRVGE